MKLIFLTIGIHINIDDHGLYTDLLRCFRDNGHDVYVVCQSEKREKKKTYLKEISGIKILQVKTGNITKTSLIEKGISTVMIGYKYRKAICRYFGDTIFDLILYSTPPITLTPVVSYLKRRNDAFAYLMLKDIFPQNAVDLRLLSKRGLKGLLYTYFRRKEHHLYACSDKIGCMSPENVKYILRHNKEIKCNKLEVCPNTIDNVPFREIDKTVLRQQFGLPEDKLIFVYGGNFGKPQSIGYILQVLDKIKQFTQIHFVMCGSGVEFNKIENYKNSTENHNLTVMHSLPYEKYESLLRASDVALVFLDHQFTIPNFPSRMLDYMNFGLPILAATDAYTDLREMLETQKFGWWCESNDLDGYVNAVTEILEHNSELSQMGMNGKKYLLKHFTTDKAYLKIVRAYEEWRKNKGNV